MSAPRQFTTRAGRRLSFSPIGFGSAPLGNYLRAMSEEECDATLQSAWNSGIRYYDTAPFYGLGLSEMRVGRLLSRQTRASFTLSSKVGRLLEPCAPEEVNGYFFVNTPQVRFVYDYSYDGVMRSHEASLKRLGVDRIDILFVHDVDALVHGSRESAEARLRELIDLGGWRALSELRSSGAVDAIGAGVNEWEPCARMLELLDPDLFLLAGRYTLLEQQPLQTLFPECQRRQVGVVIGGPFNSGILAGKDTYNYAAAPAEVVAKVRRMQDLCAEYGVSLHNAALQFVLAHPVVVSVIPGGQTVAETLANVEALQPRIPREFWEELKSRGLLDSQAPTP
ncbi:MAG TPA: aldo/keto reductase [Steroidobacter sp.]|uniref:aldo/keto reductase n=1 Tax=Steroidobacter sp. TaxID=1978227 RepID=UPI002EDB4240